MENNFSSLPTKYYTPLRQKYPQAKLNNETKDKLSLIPNFEYHWATTLIDFVYTHWTKICHFAPLCTAQIFCKTSMGVKLEGRLEKTLQSNIYFKEKF